MAVRNLIAATGSPHKVREMQALLPPDWKLFSLKDIGFTEEIVEDGASLEENALIKARTINQWLGVDVFAEDTGLEVKALNWEPGVHTARYAGPDRKDTDNMALLLSRLEGEKDRSARFRTVIALIKNGQEFLFEGIVEGRIGMRPEGDQGFGYDPVFIPEGHDESFANLGDEIKNQISHRARAMTALKNFLENGQDDHHSDSTHEEYDQLASAYSDALRDELNHKHLDRILLEKFALENQDKGLMLDMGCGPGHTTYFLSNHGANNVAGMDISEGMVKQAELHFPGIRFFTGDMLNLPFEDESVGSAIAFYAIVHFNYSQVLNALLECNRVLKPGGEFLFSFHVGDEVRHVNQLFGTEVELDFHFFETEKIRGLVKAAGFQCIDEIVRQPYAQGEVATQRAYFWIRKPVN